MEESETSSSVLDYDAPRVAKRASLVERLATLFIYLAIVVGGLSLVGSVTWLVAASSQSTTADVFRCRENSVRMLVIAVMLLSTSAFIGWRLRRNRVAS